jgi:UDP-3-O-[3-hydroxymyristoyl] glucosamine N-acyltransferase
MLLSLSVSEVMEICGPGRLEGSTSEMVRGIAALPQAGPGDLSFLGSSRYRPAVATTRATCVLVPEDFQGTPRENQVFLRVANPSHALSLLCRRLEVRLWPRPPAGIHPSAHIDASARVAASASIGPLCVVEAGAVIGERAWLEAGVFIGRGVTIGEDCRFHPGGKVLAECVIGNRVLIHAGVVIGCDGFGFETVGGVHEKIPQVGTVIIHDDVEIGANSTVDRARFSATVIGRGTKIDNLVHVGHNVVIGRGCILCAQVGIAGTTTIEDYVVMGGQAGLGGHLTVGRGSMIGGGSGVTSDLEPGSKVKGTPPLPLMTEQRINALRKRLPELFRRVAALEEKAGMSGGRSDPASNGSGAASE